MAFYFSAFTVVMYLRQHSKPTLVMCNITSILIDFVVFGL